MLLGRGQTSEVRVGSPRRAGRKLLEPESEEVRESETVDCTSQNQIEDIFKYTTVLTFM
jgi:hypothetical protein